MRVNQGRDGRGRFAEVPHDDARVDLGSGAPVLDSEHLGPFTTPADPTRNGPGPLSIEVLAAEDGRFLERRTDAEGRYHNGPNGEPAITEVDADGRIHSVLYCTHGVPGDGPNGEPACTDFTPAGRSLDLRMTDGEVNDSADGSPGEMVFDSSGEILYAASWERGVRVSTLVV